MGVPVPRDRFVTVVNIFLGLPGVAIATNRIASQQIVLRDIMSRRLT